ncbi:hypothetical protein [Roseobacter sp. CCS2]|uniref:hypothetical protein n=1 Tax=Roseobacter sp. CCS2 TaxID=391593 RepID=UPI0000F3C78F|nr:hypothetical protein [Roseobacter sp. CCS2]EBA11524.1 hypothetical protein RCCS2_16386 [Roseobacter sp. CCS2]
MFHQVKSIRAAFLACAVALIAPSIVSADQITLTFEEHGFAITGDCKSATNSSYVIVTDHGEVTVPKDMVTHDGADCVSPTAVIVAAG